MKGSAGLTGHSPRAAWMSVWHSPEASMRTSTCSGPGSGVGTSSMTSGWVKSWTTAAFMACLLGGVPGVSSRRCSGTSARRCARLQQFPAPAAGALPMRTPPRAARLRQHARREVPHGRFPHGTAATRWVYDFAAGNRSMRHLLGGKGANIAEMTRVLGCDRVPAGFTVTTEACVASMRAAGAMPDGLRAQVDEALARLEAIAGKRLGDAVDPLLLSVRSGARDSMPGMMDTVLNLGLNDATVPGLAAQTRNERFAWDCYR